MKNLFFSLILGLMMVTAITAQTTKNDFYWAYPIFKVEIDGKVVAERDLQSYGMRRMELIPTKLEKLPKHFKMKVTIGIHNSKQETIVEYEQ
jgi:hypothetical protein